MNRAGQESANSGNFRVLIALMWLAVPIVGVIYALAWSQLPARLATHFDFANHPNGWMSREASLIFFLIFTALMTGTATLILSRVKKPDPAAWALLALFYVIVGTLLWAEDSVIAYNVDGRPVNVVPPLVTGLGAAILVTIVAVAARRGSELSTQTVIAEETHGSHRWGLILGIPAIILIALGAKIPSPGLLLALGLILAMLLAGVVIAWSGFHYLFTSAGVEIRTLGFRLRSIPTSDIQSYAVDRWNAMGGYGIRGVGDTRAYVWGNTGVRVKTYEGEVFLGHDQPEKIIHDLDLVTRGHE